MQGLASGIKSNVAEGPLKGLTSGMDVAEVLLQSLASGIRNNVAEGPLQGLASGLTNLKGSGRGQSTSVVYYSNGHRKGTKCCQIDVTEGDKWTYRVVIIKHRVPMGKKGQKT